MQPDKVALNPKPILRICDFFSGTHSWTHPWVESARELGYEVQIFSIDNNQEYSQDTTVIMDFMELNSAQILEFFDGHAPDVILASPPCTAFSVASMGYHWTGGKKAYIPKSEFAELSVKLVEHLLAIIDELNPQFYWIENPRGVLRNLPVMTSRADKMERTTVWYCKYGKTAGMLRAKPTDLWGRWPKSWTPRAPCKNGNPECEHERAPRGTNKGTQGLSGNKVRSMIPVELTGEIQEACLIALLPELQKPRIVDQFPAPKGALCDVPDCSFKAVFETTFRYWTEDGWIQAGRYHCLYCRGDVL
jgi:hypothetical protein